MKKTRMKIFIISVILFFCTSTFGQKLALDVREHTLDNGIKLLMLEKHDVPIVSLRIVYKVGSVNEHPGITGASHLFEHMMFKGTEIFGTKDYDSEKPLLAKEDELISGITAEKSKGGDTDNEKLERLQKELDEVWKTQKDLIV